MSIDGRITVDCLFHDKAGTAALKVVSLESSTAYTTGKVAVITGTCGTALVQINTNPCDTYRGADGEVVSFGIGVQKVAFSATNFSHLRNTEVEGFVLLSNGGSVAVTDFGTDANNLFVNAVPGMAATASYTILLYGT